MTLRQRRANYRRLPGMTLLAVGLMAGPAALASAAAATLHETGSTLLYPLFWLWIPAYGPSEVQVSALRVTAALDPNRSLDRAVGITPAPAVLRELATRQTARCFDPLVWTRASAEPEPERG